MTISTHIKQAHKMGRLLIQADTNDGICAFGMITEAGYKNVEEFPLKKNAPCHAAYSYMAKEKKPIWVADMLYPSNLPRKTKEVWLQYLIDDSPYREMFYDKSALTILRRGYALYNTKVDGNILAAGSVAVRMLSEMPAIPESFKVMKDFNIEPHLAFLTAHTLVMRQEGKMFAISLYADEGHVSVVPSYMDFSSVSNFVDGNYKDKGLYEDTRTYRGFNNMWSFERDDYDCHRPLGNFTQDLNDEWSEQLHKIQGILPQRKALFNHDWNDDAEDRQVYVNTEEGMPILSTILNNYWEKLHA